MLFAVSATWHHTSHRVIDGIRLTTGMHYAPAQHSHKRHNRLLARRRHANGSGRHFFVLFACFRCITCIGCGGRVHTTIILYVRCVTHENYVLLRKVFCLFFRSFVRRSRGGIECNQLWFGIVSWRFAVSDNYQSDGKRHDITACLHLEITYVFFLLLLNILNLTCHHVIATRKHTGHCLTGKEPYRTKEMAWEWKSFHLQNITPFNNFVNKRNVRATNCETKHTKCIQFKLINHFNFRWILNSRINANKCYQQLRATQITIFNINKFKGNITISNIICKYNLSGWARMAIFFCIFPDRLSRAFVADGQINKKAINFLNGHLKTDDLFFSA